MPTGVRSKKNKAAIEISKHWQGPSGGGSIPLNKLEFWFDNNDSAKITLSGSNISTQIDYTGNYTRSVAAPAAGPLYVTSSVANDRKSILYQGAQGLKLSVNGFNQQQGELFIVFRRYNNASVGLNNNGILMGVTKTTANNKFALFQDFANSASLGNSIGMQIQAGATSNQVYNTDKSISDKKIIANFRSDGAAYRFGFDRDLNRGKTFNTGSNNGDWFGDIFTDTDLFSFGYRITSTNTVYGTHYEYEVMYFHTELTTDERSFVLAYLNNKHDCYKDLSTKIGVIFNGTSNTIGQSTVLPDRLKISIPKGYIRTGTNTFANLLFGTNNEGASAAQYASEMAFVPALAEYLNQDIYFEKSGGSGSRYCTITGGNPVVGGTTTWKVSSADLYPGLLTGATELQTKMNSLGVNKIIFMQVGGENDTFYTGDGSGYEVNVGEVVTGVLAGAPGISYYLFSKIRTDLVGTGGAPTRQAGAITSVQAAAQNLVNARGSSAILLDMQNYSSAGDSVHFVGFQLQLCGRDAFDLVKSLLS